MTPAPAGAALGFGTRAETAVPGQEENMKRWYTKAKPGNRQGTVADEETGRTVAVTYRAEDAAPAAAAPRMAEACAEAAEAWDELRYMLPYINTNPAFDRMRAAMRECAEAAREAEGK